MIKIEKLIINKQTINYEIKKYKYSTKLKIVIRNSKVFVIVPQGVSIRIVKDFVNQQKDWIYQQLVIYEKKLKELKIVLENGATIPFKGEKIQLRIIVHNKKRAIAEYNGKTFWVYVNKELPENEYENIVKEKLQAWYKKEARLYFQEKLDYFAQILGVEYNQLRVKEQKSRWGSCSSKGNINLNWKAILAPETIIDYLIIHELCHLKHLNHSPKFWLTVAEYYPDYKRARKWLKDNSLVLLHFL